MMQKCKQRNNLTHDHNYHKMCTTAITNAGKPRSSDPMHNWRRKITEPGIFVHRISIKVNTSATSYRHYFTAAKN